MELRGKKINFLGDSITEGFGTSKPDACFASLLEKRYGLAAARNYGVGGTHYAHQIAPSEFPAWDLDFCLRVTDMDPDADAVVVFGGTNDFSIGDAPFGTPEDRTADTFHGACHELYTRLKELFPGAAIVVITPLHRIEELSPYGDGRKTKPFPILREYVQVIRDTAKKFGFPILDLFEKGTLDPNDPAIRETYVPDGLHPNDAGHEVLAREIGQFLEALPFLPEGV